MKSSLRNLAIILGAAAALIALFAAVLFWPASNDGFILDTGFSGDTKITLTTTSPVEKSLLVPQNFTAFEENDPDIQMHPVKVKQKLSGGKNVLSLTFDAPLNRANPHIVKTVPLTSDSPALSLRVEQSYLGHLLFILISALLINNYVFTKYLGLCVFFGTSKRKKTATGMGIVFTIVMLASAIMSWFAYRYVLIPFHLDFLQVVVFIGLVSLSVQAVDTILRKVNPVLFKSFGVFLVLVIANCIIIAVPLYMASNQYNLLETVMLALGAAGGFLLALYLMSSVRERLDLAPIPESFKGLPIAFITAGQFALAFLGFSGLQLI